MVELKSMPNEILLKKRRNSTGKKWKMSGKLMEFYVYKLFFSTFQFKLKLQIEILI